MSTYTGIPLLTLPGVRDSISQAVADGATTEVAASCYYDKLKDILQYNPSWVMIPSFLKDGKAYTMISGLSGSLNITRTTTPTANIATRVNASGLIETVPDNVLRLDYPIGGGCPAALIEPSAQNLLLRSEEFEVSGTWTLVTGGTGVIPVVTPNAAISPDGTQSADNIVLNVGSGTLSSDFSIIRQNIIVSAVAYTYSIWLKSNTGTNQFVSLRFDSAPLQEVTVTNDWQRFTFTGTPVTGSRDFGLDLRGNNTSGQKNCDILAWGAQLETGAIPTSYIPTTTGQATRNADVCTVSGVSGYIGQTQGTIYVEAFIPKIPSAFVIGISNGITLGEAVYLQVSNTLNLQALIRSGGSTVGLIIAAANWTAGLNKVAFTYGSGSCSLVVNGGSPVTGTVTNVPACNRITLGSRIDVPGTLSLTDRIRAAAIYTTRLSNDQLANITRLT